MNEYVEQYQQMIVRPADVHKIAVSSQKGGVAKTTTTLSLGASLAERGVNVLVVDLDPQAHLTMALGINPDDVRHTTGDVLLNQATMVEVSRETGVYNLDIVPANRGLLLVEKLLYASKGYEFRLKTSMEAFNKHYYDVIIFDCPPSFGPITVNALAASDLLLIPVTCDYYSPRSLQAYLRLLSVVRKNTNSDIDHRLLITLYDRRTKLSKLVMEQFRQNYGPILCKTIIPIDSKLRESPVYGRPITDYASRARSAEQYRALAMELETCLKVTI